MKRVLILGSGATGATVARALTSNSQIAHVSVWDKGRGTGGRMTTTQLDDGSRVDSGAQYFSFGDVIHPLVAELIASNVLSPLDPLEIVGEDSARAGQRIHYVAPEGASAVPRHLLSTAVATVSCSYRATRLLSTMTTDSGPGSMGQSMAVVGMEDGTGRYAEESFHAVVCTIPAPQVVPLLSDVQVRAHAQGLVLDVRSALTAVKYSVRHVWCGSWSKDAEKVRRVRDRLPYAMRYVDPSDAAGAKNSDLCFISVDSRKRGSHAQANAHTGEEGAVHPCTVVLHSKGYTEGKDPQCDTPPDLAAQFAALYPGLPPPDAVKKHRWRYSQVTSPFRLPGCALRVELSTREGGEGGTQGVPLILAGDYFTESNLMGCIRSGEAAASLLREALGI